MSEIVADQFSCDACGKAYRWKPELAGRRVKCKCGQVMTVREAQSAPAEDDLYAVAPGAGDEDDMNVTFAMARKAAAMEASAAPAAAAAPARGPASPFIGYQRGPTQREQENAAGNVIYDMKRDVYVPVAILLGGLAIYVSYYAIHYQMTGFGVALTATGLSMLTAIKALLLIGFAFVVAGPLGVSFGGIWTAILKLAAIAVFSDGVTTWVDAGVAKLAGSWAFAGMISFPVALAIFWLLLIYLFSMDSGDSWMVVILLAVFDGIVRWALLILLLGTVLHWGGVAAPNVPTFGGSSTVSSDPMAVRLSELRDYNLLKEAQEYIEGGRQEALLKPVKAWKAAGAKVWFEVSRDINGHLSPEQLIVELPKDTKTAKSKAARTECYDILGAYYQEHGMGGTGATATDKGENYITVPVR
jgi:hypothetical protein